MAGGGGEPPQDQKDEKMRGPGGLVSSGRTKPKTIREDTGAGKETCGKIVGYRGEMGAPEKGIEEIQKKRV